MYIVRYLLLIYKYFWVETFGIKLVKFHSLLSHDGSTTFPQRIRRSGNVQPRAAAVSGRRLATVPRKWKRSLRHQASDSPLRSGGPYHVTTQFCFYTVIKNYKLQSTSTRGFDVRVQLNISETWYVLNVTPSWYIAMWRHSGGAWYNGLFLTIASNVDCWTGVANHVARLRQAGDTEYFEHRIKN